MAAVLITPDSPAQSAPAAAPSVTTPSATPPPHSGSAVIANEFEPSINDLVPQPEAPAEPEVAPEPEEDAAADDFDFDSPAEPVAAPEASGRTNEDRAARRVAAHRAEQLAKEVEERDRRIAELERNQITDADVKEYQSARTAADQGRVAALQNYYNRAFIQAVAKARETGDEIPVYDENTANQWVHAQMQTQQKPLAEADVERVVSRVIERAQQKGQQDFTAAQQMRAAAERKDKWEADLKAAIAEDKTGTLRRIAPLMRTHAKEAGYAHPASKYVERVTGPEKKVSGLQSGNRAAAARAAVPLSRGGGAREPATGMTRAQQIESQQMGVAELMAAHRNGTLAPR